MSRSLSGRRWCGRSVDVTNQTFYLFFVVNHRFSLMFFTFNQTSFISHVKNSPLLHFFPPQSYLNTYAFGNTIYTDLWDHLQQVSWDWKPFFFYNSLKSWCFLFHLIIVSPLFVFLLRQWITLQIFIFRARSMTSWTDGLSRWVSQWSQLTPGQEESLRNTSCWIQIRWWRECLSSSRNYNTRRVPYPVNGINNEVFCFFSNAVASFGIQLYSHCFTFGQM